VAREKVIEKTDGIDIFFACLFNADRGGQERNRVAERAKAEDRRLGGP
jgi:hypothetical protein